MLPLRQVLPTCFKPIQSKTSRALRVVFSTTCKAIEHRDQTSAVGKACVCMRRFGFQET
jgi:hypothetical protein